MKSLLSEHKLSTYMSILAALVANEAARHSVKRSNLMEFIYIKIIVEVAPYTNFWRS
jgi:hypothetical protein